MKEIEVDDGSHLQEGCVATGTWHFQGIFVIRVNCLGTNLGIGILHGSLHNGDGDFVVVGVLRYDV